MDGFNIYLWFDDRQTEWLDRMFTGQFDGCKPGQMDVMNNAHIPTWLNDRNIWQLVGLTIACLDDSK